MQFIGSLQAVYRQPRVSTSFLGLGLGPWNMSPFGPFSVIPVPFLAKWDLFDGVGYSGTDPRPLAFLPAKSRGGPQGCPSVPFFVKKFQKINQIC